MARAKGWVKLHRKILDTKLSASQFKFFVGAILLAKSPKSKDSGLVDLTVRELATELGMCHVEVWRREKELEARKMITLLKKGFAINGYNYYQTGKTVTPTKQPMDEKSPKTVTPTKQTVTSRIAKSDNKKVKKVKKEKKASFEDYKEELRSEFNDLDYDLELKKFHLYWSEGSRKLQRPKLALLNWMTKAREYKKGKEVNHRTYQRHSTKLPPRDGYTKPPPNPKLDRLVEQQRATQRAAGQIPRSDDP